MFFECICRQTFCLLQQFGLLSYRQLTPSLPPQKQHQILQTWFCENGMVQSSIQSINQNASVSYSRVLWAHECPAVTVEQFPDQTELAITGALEAPADGLRRNHSYSTAEIEEMREIINRRSIRKAKPLSKTKLDRKQSQDKPASILRYERRNPVSSYRLTSTEPNPHAGSEHQSLLMHVLQGKPTADKKSASQPPTISSRSKPVFDEQSLVADEFVF